MRVLHVSEALGGGITSAVLAMVEATPDIDHHLFARPRDGHDVGLDVDERFSSIHPMPTNPVAAIASLRSLVRSLFPDVVHAHSSIGGALARVAGLERHTMVYSPHCFAFERRDISPLARRAYRAIERTLAPRTGLFLAVAPHELDLAAELGYRDLAFVPNRTLTTPAAAARYARPLRIVTVGRVCAQKDWRYLAHLKRFTDAHVGLDATWEWIGDGDPEGVEVLHDAGVEVSGWLPNADVVERLSTAQVYVHTAAWEAAPISILESAELGLPLAVRSIPSLDSLRVPGRAAGIGALADRLASLEDVGAWTAAQQETQIFADRHSSGWQGHHLRSAYARAAGLPERPLLTVVPNGSRAVRATGPTW